MPEPRATPVRPLWLGLGLLAAATLLGLGILFWRDNGPVGVDAAWQDGLASVRGPVLLTFAYAMDWLGGGWFGVFAVPILVAGVLIALRRAWGAAFFIAAELVSAGIVQLLKHAVGRARPEDIVVVSDFGSFPSGHVANATTIAVAIVVLFPGVWGAVGGAVWVLLMAFSRTYLGAHWLSDTVGGALVGAGAALLAAA
ncbi:MAG: phosphatase PAP2 family protein, partial [Microbacterium sp.]